MPDNQAPKAMLTLHAQVASLRYDEERKGLEKLERRFKWINVRAEPGFDPWQFEIVINRELFAIRMVICHVAPGDKSPGFMRCDIQF